MLHLTLWMRQKIQGVIRYAQARPHLMRTVTLPASRLVSLSVARMSKYGEGRMYWTEVRVKGNLKNLGPMSFFSATCLLCLWHFLATPGIEYGLEENEAQHLQRDH